MEKLPKIIRELIPITLVVSGTLFSVIVLMSNLSSQDKSQLAGTCFSVAISGASGLSRGTSDE
jgi:hypothetical protein